ncbi:hypothetical protein CC1G_11618 [Coprinopsis cinerea okayama7|uniref:Uncharacterized protein n=1 Tax=Coprinopsis cinerea (strain Okayama-7 / 130 / ATCC MYA-4618 / FGSC 9003) TaxID=240176 RepID=A8PCS6_COPC7|nr:hypothetical protein CC1G_11618 [Coprinopsis cinerea okayama7\|eukprot:XP_001840461.2 hypothetical protein CC1G_11618 [Coprinopsis cinerea okayama7\
MKRRKRLDEPPGPPSYEQGSSDLRAAPASSRFDTVYSTDANLNHLGENFKPNNNPFITMLKPRRKSLGSNNPFDRMMTASPPLESTSILGHPPAGHLLLDPHLYNVGSRSTSIPETARDVYDHSSTTTNSHNSRSTVTKGSYNVTNIYHCHHYHGPASSQRTALKPDAARSPLAEDNSRLYEGAGTIVWDHRQPTGCDTVHSSHGPQYLTCRSKCDSVQVTKNLKSEWRAGFTTGVASTIFVFALF